MTMPGMQKPHCTPPSLHEGIGEDACRYSPSPSVVVMDGAIDFAQLGNAREHGFVIDIDDAAAASGLGRAAVFRRDDAQILAQKVHQRAIGVAVVR